MVKETSDSYPYVTGMGYRNRAHFVYDEFRQDDPEDIHSDGEICFVKTDFVADFFNICLPKIKHRIKLVTHNSAYGIDERHLFFLQNKKIIVWYAQNVNINYPILQSIPLGISNLRWEIGDYTIIEKVIDMRFPKEHLLYLNFSKNTNLNARGNIDKIFSKGKYVYFVKERKGFEEYLKDVARSKYVLCPEGFGIDTVRFWESLYLGSIPVVLNCQNISFYKDLPILVVDSWEEINEKMLEDRYGDFKFENMEKLYLDYWIKKIGLKDIKYQLEDKYED